MQQPVFDRVLKIIILTLACFWEATGGFWNTQHLHLLGIQILIFFVFFSKRWKQHAVFCNTSYLHVIGILDTLITQQKVNSLFARPPLASRKAVCQQSPAYVSTSEYVSTRQPLRETANCLQSANTSACLSAFASIRQHTCARQHTSAYSKAYVL